MSVCFFSIDEDTDDRMWFTYLKMFFQYSVVFYFFLLLWQFCVSLDSSIYVYSVCIIDNLSDKNYTISTITFSICRTFLSTH